MRAPSRALFSVMMLASSIAAAQASNSSHFHSSYVELRRDDFRTEIDGKPVDLYTVKNNRGMFAKITNYGAKIQQVVVPDRNGQYADVVLGYESIDRVLTGQPSSGAFIGRYANRVSGGITLDGVFYPLALNEASRGNSIHGGPRGSRFRVFDTEQLSRSSVRMSYTFADGEEGFPGTLTMQVTYSVTDQNEFVVEYSGTALDKKTVFNPTTHPFWNLSNTPGSSALDHVLTVNADRVLEVNSNLIPIGIRAVAGTPMDFRAGKPIGQDINATHYDLIALGGGYDHTYVLSKSADGRLSFAASVYEPTTGRLMEVFSTEPGCQVFSANGFHGMAPRDVGKGGFSWVQRSAIALEPMHYPNSPNEPAFPSTTLDVGETYLAKTVFKFSVR